MEMEGEKEGRRKTRKEGGRESEGGRVSWQDKGISPTLHHAHTPQTKGGKGRGCHSC